MHRSPNRLTALIVGVAFVALGVAGFAVTGGTGFFDPAGGLLFETLSVNPAQNIKHIVLGAALAIAGLSGLRPARTVNGVVGAVMLVIGMLGLFTVGEPSNVLALNGVGNVVHFGASVVLLAVGLGTERERRARPATGA